MEFTTLPGAQKPGQAEIGNWLIAIPRDAKNAEAAMDFLLWATSAEQMKRSALRGNPPTRKSLFNDPELVAKFPAYPGAAAFARKLAAAAAHAVSGTKSKMLSASFFRKRTVASSLPRTQ